MKEKKQIVMLPTNEVTSIGQSVNKQLFYCDFKPIRTDNTFNHLYILNEEEIKAGNNVYHPTYGLGKAWRDKENKIIISYKYNSPGNKANDSVNLYTGFADQKVVIASTDKSLNLPNIDLDFIKVFISRYNEGNPINEIMVEYEKYNEVWGLPNKPYLQYIKDIPKLNKNNCLIITPVKEKTYTKQEVEKLLFDMYFYGKSVIATGTTNDDYYIDDFLRRNL